MTALTPKAHAEQAHEILTRAKPADPVNAAKVHALLALAGEVALLVDVAVAALDHAYGIEARPNSLYPTVAHDEDEEPTE